MKRLNHNRQQWQKMNKSGRLLGYGINAPRHPQEIIHFFCQMTTDPPQTAFKRFIVFTFRVFKSLKIRARVLKIIKVFVTLDSLSEKKTKNSSAFRFELFTVCGQQFRIRFLVPGRFPPFLGLPRAHQGL